MRRTIKPMAKSPNRPPTISIGVMSHLGRVDPTTAAFHFLAGAREPRVQSRGRPYRHDYSPVGKPRGRFNHSSDARYGTRTVRLPPCNRHQNGVDDSYWFG